VAVGELVEVGGGVAVGKAVAVAVSVGTRGLGVAGGAVAVTRTGVVETGELIAVTAVSMGAAAGELPAPARQATVSRINAAHINALVMP
jgi:hypothetical protein